MCFLEFVPRSVQIGKTKKIQQMACEIEEHTILPFHDQLMWQCTSVVVVSCRYEDLWIAGAIIDGYK